MLTITTYGTWPRGDKRGYVEDGKTFPPIPTSNPETALA
jgi:hypothetical protein